MQGADELIKRNGMAHVKHYKEIQIKSNGVVQIVLANNDFGGVQVRNVLEKLNFVLKRYGKKCNTIVLYADEFCPKDKLSYIILEVIIYELIETYHKKVFLYVKQGRHKINTYGLKESILHDFINGTVDITGFCREFERKSRVRPNTFRRLVDSKEGIAVSQLMTDVKSFLKKFEIDKDDSKSIAGIVSELADNACEHAQSDCLVDIDVSENHYKEDGDEEEYYSINICVLNFSNILLGDQLKEKMCDDSIMKYNRYADILEAYKYHINLFNQNYSEKHFFVFFSFQDKISGRASARNTGGRGLAEIVRELEKRVDVYECYVLSGDKVIFFHPDCLETDNRGYITFNTKNDFIYGKPDSKVVSYSSTNLCGTGYNLALIYKRSK